MEPRQNLPRLLPNAEAWAWQERARCRSMDTEFFFSGDGEARGARARREQAAKQICLACPVRHECRSHAIATGEYGVWGATSENDRRTTSDPQPGRHRCSTPPRRSVRNT
ncbi:WhiB family transcriptional regulator [Rhodococcus sp. T2V]|uniref:WhiB family transcriptional regulator n=1 Tax=Rhodococcus sp. T2V TaxID=3034164 RepID=UPI0023E19B85|nr:WhiB family transcriptional regulator [Rhodococcus sp. T2V]MDF3307547.1 WhiB family transcriptional regulator [Rhodococcus sp. T2V]